MLAFSDGKTVLAMQAAQDFKRAYDGDLGPNTGGMGSHSPVPSCTPDVAGKVTDQVLEPIVAALAAEGEPYVGVIYAGIMLTPDGPKVLEFNCRFGDPETQALLPRLASDLMEPILACTDGTLSEVRLDWRPEACVAVVAAAAGYPGTPATGAAIAGLAGCFYPGFVGTLVPDAFNIVESFTMMAMVIVGGMGTMIGPVIGAIVLTFLPELLRGFGESRLMIYGLALTLVVLFMPGGIVQAWLALRSKFS